MKVKPIWELTSAIVVIKAVEAICKMNNCHVAMTGGMLYGEGGRKDLDLVIYRIRQKKSINWKGLQKGLTEIGFIFDEPLEGDWLTKALYKEYWVDFFHPEATTEGEETSE